MINRLLFIVALSLLNTISLHAQADTKGTDFWLTFGSNGSTPTYIDHINPKIRIIAEEFTTGKILFNHSGAVVPFTVPIGGCFTYMLTDVQKGYVDYLVTGVYDKTVRIQTDKPVSVYAMSQYSHHQEGTRIFPVTTLGTIYYQISNLPNHYYDWYREDAYAVVATRNNTQIYHNGVLSATLNTGQVYYHTSSSLTDMTGIRITASKPVAFFGVNQQASTFQGMGHLFEQLAPVSTWEKNFFVPVSHRDKDIVRIVVSQDSTNITQTGGTIRTWWGGQPTLTNLNAGQWVELDVTLAENGCYIQADKPIGVCSYIAKNFSFPQNSGTLNCSDASYAWVPAIEQKMTSTLLAPFIPVHYYSGSLSLGINTHYALIITSTAAKTNTTVKIGTGAEEVLSGGTWYDNIAAGMSFYSMPLTNLTAIYRYTNPAGLMVMGYGTGDCASYYYCVDLALHTAAFYVNDIYYESLATAFLCAQPLQFSAEICGMSADAGALKWYINDVEETAARDSLTWSKNLAPGTYQIKMTVLMDDDVTRTVEAMLTVVSVNEAIAIDNFSICSGTATLSVKNPVSGATYNWYDAAGTTLLDTGINFTTPVLNEATNYVVKMDGVPCLPDAAAVSIRVTQPPQVTAMNDRRICYGEEITLETFFKDGTISWNVPKTTLRPVETADYIVTASRPPCPPVSDTVRITVGDSLYINPHSLPPLKRNQFYEQLLLTNASTPQFSIVSGKLPEGLSLHTDGFISGLLSSGQPVVKNYNFTVQALDCYDCTAVRNYLLKNNSNIPLVFSPNGDNINDYFMQGYKVIIFDRLGLKIFEGNNGWDGTYNGKAAPEDIYYYILFDNDVNEPEHQQTGSITLLR